MCSAKGSLLSSTPLASRGFSAWASVGRSRVATAVVTPCRFGHFSVLPFRFSLSVALSFFGPWLGSSFLSSEPQSLLWPLLTATDLSAGGSPRVRNWSFRSRLRALHDVVDDLWASLVLACSPATSCLTARLCSFGRTFTFHPFAPAPYGDDLAVGYGWRHRPRREPFIPIDLSPAWHTSAAFTPLSGSEATGQSIRLCRSDVEAALRPRAGRCLQTHRLFSDWPLP